MLIHNGLYTKLLTVIASLLLCGCGDSTRSSGKMENISHIRQIGPDHYFFVRSVYNKVEKREVYFDKSPEIFIDLHDGELVWAEWTYRGSGSLLNPITDVEGAIHVHSIEVDKNGVILIK